MTSSRDRLVRLSRPQKLAKRAATSEPFLFCLADYQQPAFTRFYGNGAVCCKGDGDVAGNDSWRLTPRFQTIRSQRRGFGLILSRPLLKIKEGSHDIQPRPLSPTFSTTKN
jgi:hypothetical protein